MCRKTFGCFLLLAMLVVGDQHSVRGDWNQWRGDNRDGVAVNSPPLINAFPADGLKPMWVSDDLPSARDGGWSSPAIADGRVFIFSHERTKVGDGQLPRAKYPYLAPDKRVGMTDEEYTEYEKNRRDEQESRSKRYSFREYLFCMDAATGKQLWKNSRSSVYTRFPQSGTPAVVDNRVYVLGAGRIARCIDARTGDDVWTQELPGEFRDEFMQCSFVVIDGVAVVALDQVYGLNAATGEVIWTRGEKTSRTHSSPAVWRHAGKTYAIVNMNNKQTACIDVADGRELWRVDSECGHSTPLILGDRMFTFGNSRKKGLKCFELSPSEAELQWTYQGAGDPGGSPVAVGDSIYVQGEKRLACVDIESGKANWMTTINLERPRYSSLIAADGKVFYAFESLLCFAADPSDYQQIANAVIDVDGLLADEDDFRRLLKIDELEKTAEGQKEAERLWRQTFGKDGVLPCCTPAIVDGKLFLRRKKNLVCYDLRFARKGNPIENS